jgi:hypothetical protein
VIFAYYTDLCLFLNINPTNTFKAKDSRFSLLPATAENTGELDMLPLFLYKQNWQELNV